LNIIPPYKYDATTQYFSISNYEWYKYIIFYLKGAKILNAISPKEQKSLKIKSNHYVLVSTILFKRNFDGMLWNLYPLKAHQTLQ